MTNIFAHTAQQVGTTTNNRTRTTNGQESLCSTLAPNLDFFARSGNITYPNLLQEFQAALAEDEEIALRNLLHMRDIRSGKGVRKNSRTLLEWLARHRPGLLIQSDFIQKIIQLGRWDDIFILANCGNNTIANKVVKIIADEIKKGEGADNLLFKWLPTNGKRPEEKVLTSKLRSYLRLSPKDFRKMVSSKRVAFIPEFKFCNKQWSLLDYSTVPSQCFRKNRNAFQRNDQERFSSFIERVIKGDDPKAKINAGAVYPHEIVENVRNQITPAMEAQWKNLPNFMPEGVNILPVIDVSGSMCSPAYGNFECMTIAVALGVYFSERNKSNFKDLFVTFTQTASFISLANKRTLNEKFQETIRAPWAMSTNIQSVFDLILGHARQYEVPASDMPSHVIIVSDGQFDSMTRGGNGTAMQRIKNMYAQAGYEPPTLIFWNVSARQNDIQATYNEDGVVLLSGFSTSLLKSVFENTLEQYTPLNVMMSTLMDEKYNIVFH